jgi:hypothetical protein
MTKSLIEYWKDSCQLFGKDSRKLFVLATLNNLIKGIRSDSGIVAMLAMLFMCSILAANMGLSVVLWDRVFSFFTIKSALGIKLMVKTSQGVGGFFGALFTFIIAMTVMLRPSVERKDGRYLLLSLLFYLPFFLLAQELIMILPFFAYLFMDMQNRPASFFKALLGTTKLVLCHLPIVATLVVGYQVLLLLGKYIFIAASWCGLPVFLSGGFLPLLWFVLVMGVFYSACAMYYTKVKHTDRELLFGKQ